MMRKCTYSALLIGFLLLGQLDGQVFKVSGKVLDAITGSPVQNVSLYLNATTVGATSGSTGYFELYRVPLPGELIISHVSYELMRIPLEDTAMLTGLEIRLEPRIVALREATVVGNQLRSRYLDRFRSWFLGTGYKDLNAEILNDSVLIFISEGEDQLEAYANEPLQILLPTTGYLIRSDLVRFKLSYEESLKAYHCSILGYFYFEELEVNSKRQQRDVARNRVDSYYNSRMHFCRSLYQNKLAENGYILTRTCFNEDEIGDQHFKYENFHREYVETGTGTRMLYLSGFPCATFQIHYYFRGRNKPADLNTYYAHPSNAVYSGLRILTDTVRIHPSGRIPENSMVFSSTIGSKGVAWMLPDDYIPSMR